MKTKQEHFERITRVIMPFDRRDTDPTKNYGIHGMELRFILLGDVGATQFVYFTGQHLPSVSEELYRRQSEHNPFRGMAADIGYHSPTPNYVGQPANECDLLEEGVCFYDGSGLRAQEFEKQFFEGGTDAVWAMLEREYALVFGAV